MEEKFIPNNQNLGLLILRITIALLFLYGGVGKLFGVLGGPGIEGFSGMVWGQVWLAYIVGITELLAALGILFGIFEKLSSVALIVVMAFAIGMIHNIFVDMGQLMNALIRLVIIGGLVQIMLNGAGTMFNMKNMLK